jgi:hypothetical protein
MSQKSCFLVVFVASGVFLGSFCDFRGHHSHFLGFDDPLWGLEMNDMQQNYMEFLQFLEACDSGQGPANFPEWLIMIRTTKAVTRVTGPYIWEDQNYLKEVNNKINLN